MYLTGATLVVWTVILINYDRVLHIIQNNVLKMNIRSEPIARSSPRLNPHSIRSPDKS